MSSNTFSIKAKEINLNQKIILGSSSGRGSHVGPEEEQLDSASALGVPLLSGLFQLFLIIKAQKRGTGLS